MAWFIFVTLDKQRLTQSGTKEEPVVGLQSSQKPKAHRDTLHAGAMSALLEYVQNQRL